MKINFSVTLKILVVLAVVFLLQIVIPGFTELFYFNPKALGIWMFVTSIFLHGSITHIAFNAFALLMFGPYLENKIGGKQFLILFLSAGIIGNILYWATILAGIIPAVPALGASGAIYGILGMLSVIAPELIVFVFYFPLPIRIATIVWILLEFFGSFDASSGIGSAAHLGGLVFGILYGMYGKPKQRRKKTIKNDDDEEWEKELRGSQ